MKRIYLFLVLCCLGFAGRAQIATPTCLPTSSSWYDEDYDYDYGVNRLKLHGYGSSALTDGGLCGLIDETTGYLSHRSLTTTLTVQQGGSYSDSAFYLYDEGNQAFQMWIDFNDDGTFQVSEEVTPVSGYTPSYGVSSPWRFTMSIPLSADTGMHLMRMRGIYEVYYYTTGLPTHLDPCLVDYGGYSPEYDGGDVVDYKVHVIAAPPCSGVPVAGTPAVSPSAGDAVSLFTLTLPSLAIATGYTYQWQTSPTGTAGTWTNITGATTAPYSFTGIDSNTYFRAIVRCSITGDSTITSSIMATYLLLPTCYPTSSSWAYEVSYYVQYGVDQLKLNGYGGSRTTDASLTTLADASTGYLSRLSHTPLLNVEQGGSYTDTAFYGYDEGNQAFQIWVDFNDNGTFEVSEEVTPVSGYTASYGGSATAKPFTMSIPLSGDTGTHLMRVRGIYEYYYSTGLPSHLDPCLIEYGGSYPEYEAGDVIDYLVHVTPAPLCSGTPVAGSPAISPSAGDAASSFTLSLPSLSIASGYTFQWQKSTTGTAGTWTNISGATTVPYTFTGIDSNTYFRAIVRCSITGDSTVTGNVMATYLLLPTCYPTSSSWAYEASYYLQYGVDQVRLNGYSGSRMADASLTSAADGSTGYLSRLSHTPVLNVEQGGNYADTAYYGYDEGDQAFQMWIDFNDNGTFEVSEEVTPVSGFTTSYGGTASAHPFTMSIPLTADTGTHLMRVRGIYEYYYGTGLPSHLDPCLIEYGGSYPEYEAGDVVDYLVHVTPAPPCSGTPVTGSPAISPDFGDVVSSFTLSLPSIYIASGYTYQWQTSPTGTAGSWSNISGATSLPYTFTGIDSNTYFRAIVRCSISGDSTITDSVMARYQLLPSCYPTSASWEYEASYYLQYGIDTLAISGYSGSTLTDGRLSSRADATTGYLSRLSRTPILNLQQAGSYSGTAYYGYDEGNQAYQIWIDFNDDGTFQVSEEVTPVSGYTTTYGGTPSPMPFTLNIPFTADTGTHLMRVRGIYEYYYSTGLPTHLDPCLVDYGGTSPEYEAGDVIDYLVNIVPLPPCTGMPVTGTPAISPAIGDAVTTFTLTLPGSTVAAALAYQWQSSSTGAAGSWSNITGATAYSYTFTGIAANTYFRAIIRCTVTGDSAVSDSVIATYQLLPACLPTASSWTNENASTKLYGVNRLDITGAASTSIHETSITPSVDPLTGYLSRLSLTPLVLELGSTYSASLRFGVDANYQEAQIWIDFNDDGTFQATEEVTPVAGYTTGTTAVPVVTTITIPSGSDTGTHLMRVRGIYESSSYTLALSSDLDPCLVDYGSTGPHYLCGDVIDYRARITPFLCTGTPDAGTISATSSGSCAAFTTTLAAAGGTSGAGIGYQWQSSADGVTYTNIAGATSDTYTASVSATAYYRFQITCVGSGLSAYTSRLLISIYPAPVVTGPTNVCPGTTDTLVSSIAGSSWTSDATGIATVNALGIVTGVASGTANITALSPHGCSTSVAVTVNSSPAAVTGPTVICVGSTATYADATAGGTWSSRNPGVATISASGVVTGVAAGIDTVTYTSSIGCPAILSVTVSTAIDSISGPAVVCASASISLSAGTGTWSSTNTAVATVDASGTVTGHIAGVDTIVFTSTVGCGVLRKVVTVNALPAAIAGADTVCNATMETLTDATPGGTWTATGAVTISSTGVLAATAPGTGIVTYTLPTTGCYVSFPVDVRFSPEPLVSITASPVGTVCAGTEVTYTASGINAGTSPVYQWSVNGINTSTGMAYTYAPSNGDILTVGLTSSLACAFPAVVTSTDTISINPIITPVATIISSLGDTVCESSTVTLSASVSGGGTHPLYQWTINGVNRDTTATYTYTPANGDLISVTVTSNAPCLAVTTATNNKVLIVLPYEVPVVTILPSSDTVCGGTGVTYTPTATYGGDAPTYDWLVNGVIVYTGPVFGYIPVDSDVVTAVMHSTYHCRIIDSASSNAVMVTVNPFIVPSVTISGALATIGSPVTLTASVTDGGPTPSYQWIVNTTVITGATNAVFISDSLLHTGDSVTCVVTSGGTSCPGIISFKSVVMTLAPESVSQVSAAISNVKLVPNPNAGVFYVEGTIAGTDNVTVEITDLVGQVIYTESAPVQNNTLKYQVNLRSTIANGVYLLHIVSSTDNQVVRFNLNR